MCGVNAQNQAAFFQQLNLCSKWSDVLLCPWHFLKHPIFPHNLLFQRFSNGLTWGDFLAVLVPPCSVPKWKTIQPDQLFHRIFHQWQPMLRFVANYYIIFELYLNIWQMMTMYRRMRTGRWHGEEVHSCPIPIFGSAAAQVGEGGNLRGNLTSPVTSPVAVVQENCFASFSYLANTHSKSWIFSYAQEQCGLAKKLGLLDWRCRM